MNWWQKLCLKVSGWFLPKGWVVSTFEESNKQEGFVRQKQAVTCFTRGYRCFSGTDIKLYMVPFGKQVEQEIPGMVTKDGGPVFQKVGAVAAVNALQLKDKGDHFGGTMTFVVFDGLDEVESLRGKKMNVLCVAADEYGKVATLLDKPVVFSQYYNWGISIDDISTEATIDFTVIEDDI